MAGNSGLLAVVASCSMTLMIFEAGYPAIYVQRLPFLVRNVIDILQLLALVVSGLLIILIARSLVVTTEQGMRIGRIFALVVSVMWFCVLAGSLLLIFIRTATL